ncbi:glycosyl transferase [Sphingomonas oleivorans]|uniref:Glycosyl transferase n=1 Tax=Sphingomonas oleivorans TaxID=1735121 RepID=A0A2T5FW15_9SPHN|nr:WecB/TagA/CpsF family glycosyltransferase [Sphingomonas oleivorans]PTQ09976.1 glycosyl transferase [Sphingomonas oleivorans]
MRPPPADRPDRRWFLGVEFTPLTIDAAVRRIVGRDPGAPFAYVVTPNAQHAVAAWHGDMRFAAPQRSAWLRLNDSAILNLLSRRLFHDALALAPGSDLTAALFAGPISPEDRLTIIGGSAEMERRLRDRFGMRHIARHDPPMGFIHDPAEVERCVAFVLANPARYIFFAVGAPQSEMVALEVHRRGDAAGVGLCIGSSLNFLTGLVPRAPRAFRRANLEWLYRLGRNPIGHARRVFIESVPILAIAARARMMADQDRAHRGKLAA